MELAMLNAFFFFFLHDSIFLKEKLGHLKKSNEALGELTKLVRNWSHQNI